MPDPSPRHVQSSVQQEVLVLTITEPQVRGDELADDLREEFAEAVDASGLSKVAVDLQHVKYLSSAGLRPFIHLRRKLWETGGQIRLCNVAQPIAEVFRMTRLFAAPFEIQPDVAAAVADLHRS